MLSDQSTDLVILEIIDNFAFSMAWERFMTEIVLPVWTQYGDVIKEDNFKIRCTSLRKMRHFVPAAFTQIPHSAADHPIFSDEVTAIADDHTEQLFLPAASNFLVLFSKHCR